ncbi:MAG: hypothetical protein HYY54_04925 [candidate division NC10 bacterium]|nr:hypothetical protein [candidate division NC10 bacterium]MBI3002952.1 hypothetical protein [candidate division NC10 bacterium]
MIRLELERLRNPHTKVSEGARVLITKWDQEGDRILLTPPCRTAPELNRHLDQLIKQLQDIREQGLVYLAGIFRE